MDGTQIMGGVDRPTVKMSILGDISQSKGWGIEFFGNSRGCRGVFPALVGGLTETIQKPMGRTVRTPEVRPGSAVGGPTPLSVGVAVG